MRRTLMDSYNETVRSAPKVKSRMMVYLLDDDRRSVHVFFTSIYM